MLPLGGELVAALIALPRRQLEERTVFHWVHEYASAGRPVPAQPGVPRRFNLLRSAELIAVSLPWTGLRVPTC